MKNLILKITTTAALLFSLQTFAGPAKHGAGLMTLKEGVMKTQNTKLKSHAGPVISGGGTQTVNEASGQAQVTVIGSQSLVYISDEAAELLFETLDVEPVTPPMSESLIKQSGNVECTRNPNETVCVIAVANQ